MRKGRKIRKKLLIVLIGILCLMVAGYAAFSTTLNIKGTSNITSEWNIQITDVSVSKTNGSAESVESSFIDLSASMEADLYNKGDYIEYDVTVSNKGNVDARLNLINFNGSSNDAVKISYSGVEENLILFKNSTIIVKVKIEYNPSYSGNDNTSGLATIELNFVQATGVKLPETSLIASDTLRKICTATSGEGLYNDIYENGRCIYKGSNPNNYITFNNELWRIIAVENDNTLKIMRNESIGYMVFDPGNSTFIDGVTNSDSDIGTRIEGTKEEIDFCWYNIAYAGAEYAGCNLWGNRNTMLDESGNSVTKMPMEIGGKEYKLPEKEAYINTYLNTVYYNSINEDNKYIDNHLFNVGLLSYPFGQTFEEDILQENLYKWQGKIGLISPIDYVKGSLDLSCKNIKEAFDSSVCKNNNYLNKSSDYWTMVLLAIALTSHVYNVSPNSEYSQGSLNFEFSFDNKDIFPTLYLKSNISLTGAGTKSNPYKIN